MPLLCLRSQECGADLHGTVELHFTYDEESGGEIGPRFCCKRAFASGFCDLRRLLLLPS